MRLNINNMKKIIVIIIAFLAGIQAYSQVVDLKNLVTKTPQEIVNLYPGSTLVEDAMWDYGYGKVINNNDFFIGYYLSDGEISEVENFYFTYSGFCVLSDYIEGGIKVGDSLARLQSIDFVNTLYGRGKQGNALVKVDDEFFRAYALENAYFDFEVVNGLIVRICYVTLEDCDPNNINPNSPFGN